MRIIKLVHRSKMELMEGLVNGYDNTNVMLWKLGPEDKNIGEYLAVTDYPLVHQMDMETLAVIRKSELNMLTDGMSVASCAHWRREVGTDNSLNYHMMLNPFTLETEFTLYRFGNSFTVLLDQ
jgi:hypothetical protein